MTSIPSTVASSHGAKTGKDPPSLTGVGRIPLSASRVRRSLVERGVGRPHVCQTRRTRCAGIAKTRALV